MPILSGSTAVRTLVHVRSNTGDIVNPRGIFTGVKLRQGYATSTTYPNPVVVTLDPYSFSFVDPQYVNDWPAGLLPRTLPTRSDYTTLDGLGNYVYSIVGPPGAKLKNMIRVSAATSGSMNRQHYAIRSFNVTANSTYYIHMILQNPVMTTQAPRFMVDGHIGCLWTNLRPASGTVPNVHYQKVLDADSRIWYVVFRMVAVDSGSASFGLAAVSPLIAGNTYLDVNFQLVQVATSYTNAFTNTAQPVPVGRNFNQIWLSNNLTSNGVRPSNGRWVSKMSYSFLHLNRRTQMQLVEYTYSGWNGNNQMRAGRGAWNVVVMNNSPNVEASRQFFTTSTPSTWHEPSWNDAQSLQTPGSVHAFRFLTLPTQAESDANWTRFNQNNLASPAVGDGFYTLNHTRYEDSSNFGNRIRFRLQEHRFVARPSTANAGGMPTGLYNRSEIWQPTGMNVTDTDSNQGASPYYVALKNWGLIACNYYVSSGPNANTKLPMIYTYNPFLKSVIHRHVIPLDTALQTAMGGTGSAFVYWPTGGGYLHPLSAAVDIENALLTYVVIAQRGSGAAMVRKEFICYVSYTKPSSGNPTVRVSLKPVYERTGSAGPMVRRTITTEQDFIDQVMFHSVNVANDRGEIFSVFGSSGWKGLNGSTGTPMKGYNYYAPDPNYEPYNTRWGVMQVRPIAALSTTVGHETKIKLKQVTTDVIATGVQTFDDPTRVKWDRLTFSPFGQQTRRPGHYPAWASGMAPGPYEIFMVSCSASRSINFANGNGTEATVVETTISAMRYEGKGRPTSASDNYYINTRVPNAGGGPTDYYGEPQTIAITYTPSDIAARIVAP